MEDREGCRGGVVYRLREQADELQRLEARRQIRVFSAKTRLDDLIDLLLSGDKRRQQASCGTAGREAGVPS
ncbi:hypothetical protein [Actinacidiphila sp. bgisy144]|uniref:hypothetical protein n=1 Tax=Actinacidiphila sp. bgisy144 TaxID=3413791 RepID=UPI003EBBE5BB